MQGFLSPQDICPPLRAPPPLPRLARPDVTILGPCVGRCPPGAAWGVRSRGIRGAAAADMRGTAETSFLRTILLHLIFAPLIFLHCS